MTSFMTSLRVSTREGTRDKGLTADWAPLTLKDIKARKKIVSRSQAPPLQAEPVVLQQEPVATLSSTIEEAVSTTGEAATVTPEMHLAELPPALPPALSFVGSPVTAPETVAQEMLSVESLPPPLPSGEASGASGASGAAESGTADDALLGLELELEDDDWGSFDFDPASDEMRLGITVDEDVTLRPFHHVERELGVLTYYRDGHKVLAADGFYTADAFPMFLKYLNNKLYGVLTKAFDGNTFSNEVKLHIPKAYKSAEDTADALAVLLFYLLRERIRADSKYSHLIDSTFEEVSQDVLENYKNVRFTELVKSYVFVVFNEFCGVQRLL